MTIAAYLLSLACAKISGFYLHRQRLAQSLYLIAIVSLIFALAYPRFIINIILASLAMCLLLERLVPSQRVKNINAEQLRAFCYFALSSLIIHIYSRLDIFPSTNEMSGTMMICFSFLGVLILDLKNYILHRLQHKYDWWWKIHFVHHNQSEISVFSAGPVFLIEWVFLRLFFSSVLLYLLHLPLYSVILYAQFAVISGVWSHANIKLPRRLSALIEFVFVTPDYHRHHHISHSEFERSNFSDIFTLWDRLFGTYRAPKLLTSNSFSQNLVPQPTSIFREQFMVAKAWVNLFIKT